MDGRIDPWRVGFRDRGSPCDRLGRVPKTELPLGRARSLLDLLPEFHFFTPAVLYLLNVIRDQPLADFQAEYGQVDFFYRKFRLPLLRGLDVEGDPDWNHVLWALRRQHWPAFLDFYCSVAVRVRASGVVQRVAAQTLELIDPLCLEGSGLIGGRAATLKVTAFGVNGSRYRAAFEQQGDPLLRPPCLRFYPPDAQVRHYARALDRGDNPHRAEEDFLRDLKEHQREQGPGGTL